MRALNMPGGYFGWTITSLVNWLATKSTGNFLDIGCQMGIRARLLATTLSLRGKRSAIAVDWSGEHRINEKQRRAFAKMEIGRDARAAENAIVLDVNPELLPIDEFHPISLVLIDYDYALTILRRITEAVMSSMSWTAEENACIAWAGYTREKKEYPSDVFNYVNSLELGDTYHFEGSELAFKVFNATPEFRAELRGLAKI